MPTRPPKPCGHPGCRRLVPGGYCELHAPIYRREAWATTTESSSDRGYGSLWQRLRKVILNRDPICTVCGREPATEVDHILRKAAGGTDDEGNLRGICDRCHTRKTAQDARAGLGARTQ